MGKNYIEVILVPVSFFGWLFNWCAPIIGIILMQAIRVKYLGSHFTRTCMANCDLAMQDLLPEFLYSVVVAPIKSFLCGLSGVKEQLAHEAEQAKKAAAEAKAAVEKA